MTELRRPRVPLSPRPPADPITMPLPRMGPPPARVPGPRAPLPSAGPLLAAPPSPSPQQPPPRGRGRPILLAVIAVAAAAVLVLGVVLVARPGVLVALQPCDAPAGSTLPGFEDVVGPNGGAGSLLQSRVPGGQLCSYINAGALAGAAGPSGHMVLLLRAPRAAVDADPEMSELFRNAAAGVTSSSSSSYPVSLVRSGVTLVASPSADGSANAVSATCVVGSDYWTVNASSSTQQDDAGAMDTLLVAMGCGPVPS